MEGEWGKDGIRKWKIIVEEITGECRTADLYSRKSSCRREMLDCAREGEGLPSTSSINDGPCIGKSTTRSTTCSF